MGNTPSSNKPAEYNNKFRFQIREATPFCPTVNHRSYYKQWDTKGSKTKDLRTGIFYSFVSKTEEFLPTGDRIKIKDFEEHTVKAGSFDIYTIEGRVVGRLNYFKALTVGFLDVQRTVDFIIENLYHTDPIDGYEKINFKYFSILNDANYALREVFKNYELFKKYGLWFSVSFNDPELSSDLLNYKHVLTQFKHQPVSKDLYKTMAFCHFDNGQDLMIVKEENLYLSTALINLNESFKKEHYNPPPYPLKTFFAYDLGPPSFETIMIDKELASI